MKALEEKIIRDGLALGTEIVKVDSFLNHQIDTAFLIHLGDAFYRIFAAAQPNKILTMESSGISIAVATAVSFDKAPVVFAKKNRPQHPGGRGLPGAGAELHPRGCAHRLGSEEIPLPPRPRADHRRLSSAWRGGLWIGGDCKPSWRHLGGRWRSNRKSLSGRSGKTGPLRLSSSRPGSDWTNRERDYPLLACGRRSILFLNPRQMWSPL